MRKPANKKDALRNLSNAVNLTAKKIKVDDLLVDNNSTITVGRLRVIKDGMYYTVIEGTKTIADGVALLESAIAIAVCVVRNTRNINSIIKKDNEYDKHRTDMLFYANSHRCATKNRGVFVDRYLVSRDKARAIRATIEQYSLLV